MPSSKFDIGSLDLDLDIHASDTFTPNMIMAEYMPLLFQNVPESVKIHARNLKDTGWKFYSVKQSRGRCYYRSKTITIPVWAIDKTARKPGYKVWYISHEMSHALDLARSNHGSSFMRKLQEICPPEFVHYELGYKPRNAAAAGIILNLEL